MNIQHIRFSRHSDMIFSMLLSLHLWRMSRWLFWVRIPIIRMDRHMDCVFPCSLRMEIPPSLENIYKELHDDLGCYIPNNGYLEKWAKQGVLLLNTVLTVRAHQANSHRGIGWEQFTDAAIRDVE